LLNVVNSTSATTTSTTFDMSAMPFNSLTNGGGALTIVPSDDTTYEVNGTATTGSAGLSQLASLGSGTLTVAYGTLASTESTTTTTSSTDGTDSTAVSTSTVTFAATQVLAGGSVQGAGLDRVSGTVSARSGNTLTLEDATLVAADGSEAFLAGTTFVIMGPNTVVTEFGNGGAEIFGVLQVSVGSVIEAFGLVTGASADNATLDASAGRVRLDPVTASGLVTAQGSEVLDLNLALLGGRTVTAMNFVGSDATPSQYVVDTGALDLTYSTAGAPVTVTGFTGAFAAGLPNFTANTLLDPTTIPAELVVDWPSGTAAPFTTYNSASIDINVVNSAIGTRHQIQDGAQTINVVGLASVLIVPSSTSSATVFTIGHSSSATTESFNTYAAFIAQLQTELNGTTLATAVTATGPYTASTFTLSATSITLILNN
jgi:hypothetical protein